MGTEQYRALLTLPTHRLSWADFDSLAKNDDDVRVTTELRRVERSRRLLLLRALVDESGKAAGIPGPLSAVDAAWELLARVEEKNPAALELIIAHPYTGSWLGYTMRLLRSHISGIFALWVHVGHIHALAAAAAIRAGLDFQTTVPITYDGVMLPTLGFARLPTAIANSPVATITATDGQGEISYDGGRISIPSQRAEDTLDWWGVRQLTSCSEELSLSVRLDDLDPYRGLYEPIPPARLGHAEATEWRVLFDEAWRLIVRYLPTIAATFPIGLNSLAPASRTGPFQGQSASNGEAFGSAVIARPSDSVSLAATLIHEYQHIRLSGLLHVAQLCKNDVRERFYAPWRDDPRPIGGMLQGIYAFFGVTGYWRAVARTGPPRLARRAGFEFARWRDATWTAAEAVRSDTSLTATGRRFLDGIAERLEAWRGESVPDSLARLAWLVSADHYAGWRLRHVRPAPAATHQLAEAWLSGARLPPSVQLERTPFPTPVPDGSWQHARAALAQLAVAAPEPGESAGATAANQGPQPSWLTVPGATAADRALIVGQCAEATRMYEAELATDPGRPASWAGLGLAMSGTTALPVATGLLRMPELVRAVHRQIRISGHLSPRPYDLASWIGRGMG